MKIKVDIMEVWQEVIAVSQDSLQACEGENADQTLGKIRAHGEIQNSLINYFSNKTSQLIKRNTE